MFASFDGGKQGQHGDGGADADGEKVEDGVHEELSARENGNREYRHDRDEVADGAKVDCDGVRLAHGDANGWGEGASVLSGLSVTGLL